MGQYFCLVNLDKRTKHEIHKLNESLWDGWPINLRCSIRVRTCAEARNSIEEFRNNVNTCAYILCLMSVQGLNLSDLRAGQDPQSR